MRPDGDMPPGLTPLGVIGLLVRDPWRHLGAQWNYKSALMSSLSRGFLFFVINLTATFDAAVAALLVEFSLRSVTAGFYGALTQAFRRVEPERAAFVAVMVLLPLANHSIEFIVHGLRGTPRLLESVFSSIALTAISTAFNLFAMRRGALIVGAGSQPLRRDLIRMPALIAAFLLSWRSRPST
jgi:hypothetical protein